MAAGFRLDSWGDVGALITVFGAICAALGILGTQFYNRLKNRRDEQAADDALTDRIIKLVETEADKRVAAMKADFELQIATMKLEHAKQLTTMRNDFNRQIAEVRHDAEAYRCDAAPGCVDRVRNAATLKPGGTD